MATVNRPNAPQVYRTPPELLEAVQRRFGAITFDAACMSTDKVAPYGYAIDLGLDALAFDWREHLRGEITWCNPMWRDAGEYAAKCAQLAEAGGRVLLNVQLAPDSNWYAEHVHGRALVLALNPRVPYLNPDGSPAFTDRNGKALGINRPVMVAAYGFGQTGFEPWKWKT
jgi:hypothetical protein